MKYKLAYLSGYIDGDGCFFLSNYNKFRSKLIISSTEPLTLQFFKKNFGGNIIEVQRSKISWKKQYHWYIGGVKFIDFIGDLFLVEKRKDREIFYRFIKAATKENKQRILNKMKDFRKNKEMITEKTLQEIKVTPYKGNLSDIDSAYLAGFIDAECCLSVSKYQPKNRPNPTYKIYLKCNNTSPIIFFWLKEKLGGSFVHIKRNRINPKHRDQICWTLSARSLYSILPKILPFLITKKSVCKKLMEFYDTTKNRKTSNNSKDHTESYKEVLSLRESILDDIHKLNSKGSSNV